MFLSFWKLHFDWNRNVKFPLLLSLPFPFVCKSHISFFITFSATKLLWTTTKKAILFGCKLQVLYIFPSIGAAIGNVQKPGGQEAKSSGLALTNKIKVAPFLSGAQFPHLQNERLSFWDAFPISNYLWVYFWMFSIWNAFVWCFCLCGKDVLIHPQFPLFFHNVHHSSCWACIDQPEEAALCPDQRRNSWDQSEAQAEKISEHTGKQRKADEGSPNPANM